MNAFHRWYCNSARWARRLQGEYMPAVLRDVDLGDDVLEIGPGPGMSTDWLRARVPRLTSIEIDHRLAESLKRRLQGAHVTVVEGDATSMPFSDAAFSGVVCFTMLHHVPSPPLQDRLLAETCRVLRPGAPFAGMDSTPGLLWNLYHLLDDRNPVAPATFAARLGTAGFEQITVQHAKSGFAWRARKG